MASSVKTIAGSLASTIKYPPKLPHQLSDWTPALLEIQVLYLKGQYKDCVAKCELLAEGVQGLFHPLHLIYLHFYAASCLESTAESVHPLSANKLPVLERAKQHYTLAGSMLPSRPAPQSSRSPSRSPSSVLPPPLSPTSMSSVGTATPSTPPDSYTPFEEAEGTESEGREEEDAESWPPTPTSFASSSFLFPSPSAEDKLEPSPLRIRKMVRFATSSTLSLSHSSSLTPLPLHPSKNATTMPSTPKSNSADSDHDHNYFQDGLTRISYRYTTHLYSLSTQVANHISTLNLVIARTVEDQSLRRVTHFADLRNARFDEEVRVLDRQTRIERLRASGWRRERFNGERYQELARLALAEL